MIKYIIVGTGQSNGKGTYSVLQSYLPENWKIINCAVGGTSVFEWQRGGELFRNTIQAVNNEKEDGNIIAGLVHFQGEAETSNEKKAEQWLPLTDKLLKQLRNNIGNPYLPTVLCQLGAKPNDMPRPYWKFIQTKQLELWMAHPEMKFVQTKDITPYCDLPHWCTDGYMKIAERVARAFRQFRKERD